MDSRMVAKGRSSGSCSSSTSGSQWSNLPADVLQLIAKQYLDIFDGHSLTAVCKDWNLQSSSILHPPEPEPPWLLSRDLRKLCQSLYVKNKPCMITPGSHTRIFPDCYRCPVASKLGWVLMGHGRINDASFFLWNPFSHGKRMKILDLPPLETNCYYPIVTFSCRPDSSECVVFEVKYQPRISKDLVIQTCHPRDPEWKKHVFSCELRQDKLDSVRSIVYMEQYQMLYCLLEDGSLGAFCSTDNSWNLLIDVR